jgi:thioesterase domain-containing protein
VNALGYLFRGFHFLAHEFGSDQPVYGLQIKLEEDPVVDFTAEQDRLAAAEHIRDMKKVQPQGPYYMLGQCQGVYIVNEMVRQLEEADEEVAFFGTLDTWPDENTRYRSLFWAHLMWKRIQAVNRGTFQKALKKIRLRSSSPKASDTASIPQASGPAPKRKTLFQAYWPGKDFHPYVCACAITVFRTSKQDWFRKKDETIGWGNRTHGGVKIRRIPGDHDTHMREPHVRVLAARIAEDLGIVENSSQSKVEPGNAGVVGQSANAALSVGGAAKI